MKGKPGVDIVLCKFPTHFSPLISTFITKRLLKVDNDENTFCSTDAHTKRQRITGAPFGHFDSGLPMFIVALMTKIIHFRLGIWQTGLEQLKFCLHLTVVAKWVRQMLHISKSS